MRKVILVVCVALLFSVVALSQIRIKGLICEADGKPLTNQWLSIRCSFREVDGSRIFFKKKEKRIKTNDVGKFDLNVSPEISPMGLQSIQNPEQQYGTLMLKVEIDPRGDHQYTWIAEGALPLSLYTRNGSNAQLLLSDETYTAHEIRVLCTAETGEPMMRNIAKAKSKPTDGSTAERFLVTNSIQVTSSLENDTKLHDLFRNLVYLHHKTNFHDN